MRNFGERVMRFCPHFSVNETAACFASEGEQYQPSGFQQKEYCTSNVHLLCPYFMVNAPIISLAYGQVTEGDR